MFWEPKVITGAEMDAVREKSVECCNKLLSVLLEYLQSWLPDAQCSGCPSSLKLLRVVSQFSEIRGYF